MGGVTGHVLKFIFAEFFSKSIAGCQNPKISAQAKAEMGWHADYCVWDYVRYLKVLRNIMDGPTRKWMQQSLGVIQIFGANKL